MSSEELVIVFLGEVHRWDDTVVGIVREPELDEEFQVKGKSPIEDGMEYLGTYRLFGSWKKYTNRRTGQETRQFCFNSFTESQPYGEMPVRRYLERCKGIGPKASLRLYGEWGDKAVEVLREQPDVVASTLGLGADICQAASQLLMQKKYVEGATIELLSLLDGYGFPKGIAQKCIDKWGTQAPASVRNDPYILQDFKGAGFKRCDSMYLRLGGDPAAVRRQALCATYYVKADSNGDSHFHRKSLVSFLDECIGGTKVRWDEAIEYAISHGLLTRVWTDGVWGEPALDGDEDWYRLGSTSLAYRRIIKSIKKAIYTEDCNWPDISQVEGISDHQREQLAVACTHNIGIFGGSGGTGKTFTIARLVEHIQEHCDAPTIALAAPTGKAAVRMTEAMQENGIELEATTWHRMLGYQYDDDSGGMSFAHDSEEPLPQMFIIGDESSMLDDTMMAYVLDARKRGACVLLVGDIHQLPPVGRGAPLRDLIEAGVPCGNLTEIRRNSGRIVKSCLAIRQGKPWGCSSTVDIQEGENLESINCSEPQSMLMEVLSKYKALAAQGFDRIKDVQVIAAVNKKKTSPVSRQTLNELLQEKMNPNPAIKGSTFRLDDKVVNRKNSEYTEVELDSMTGKWERLHDGEELKKVYVANGDQGVVKDVQPKGIVVELMNGTCLTAYRGEPKDVDDEDVTSTGSNWDLAWAITCHLSQGAEYKNIIVVIDENARRLCNREWIYTAISRAKRLCTLVGKVSVAKQMCNRSGLQDRKTFLASEVCDVLKNTEVLS